MTGDAVAGKVIAAVIALADVIEDCACEGGSHEAISARGAASAAVKFRAIAVSGQALLGDTEAAS